VSDKESGQEKKRKKKRKVYLIIKWFIRKIEPDSARDPSKSLAHIPRGAAGPRPDRNLAWFTQTWMKWTEHCFAFKSIWKSSSSQCNLNAGLLWRLTCALHYSPLPWVGAALWWRRADTYLNTPEPCRSLLTHLIRWKKPFKATARFTTAGPLERLRDYWNIGFGSRNGMEQFDYSSRTFSDSKAAW